MCSSANRAEELARKLDTEFTRAVPAGSPKANVITFLKAHGIEYHEDLSSRLVTASIRDVQRNLITRFGVFMKFTFDDAGRLQTHEIKAVGTGP
jgi:hypothetical protein